LASRSFFNDLLAAASILLGSCTVQSTPATPRTSAAAPAFAEGPEAVPEDAPSGSLAGAVADKSEAAGELDEPDDGGDDDGPPVSGEERPHPLDSWTEERIASAVATDLGALGSMSVGNPSAGMLINGRAAQKNELFVPVAPATAWGTEETLEYLSAALRKVKARYPDTPALPLGDISAERGGRLSPHVSHQSGRDVDIGYFYRGDERWYRRGTAQNLDIEKNWAFVSALVTEADVELIFIDRSIQQLLEDYALAHGDDSRWVKSLFSGDGAERPIIRHARGHATHMHIRFYNPIAQETARRANAPLVARGIVPPAQSYLSHRAKRGDTLGKLSKRYGVSVDALKRANHLRSSRIRERKTYLIPVSGPRTAPSSRRLSFPPRRLPPEPSARSAEAAVDQP